MLFEKELREYLQLEAVLLERDGYSEAVGYLERANDILRADASLLKRYQAEKERLLVALRWVQKYVRDCTYIDYSTGEFIAEELEHALKEVNADES